MGKLNARYIWPLVGLIIYMVLVALYIDDRRKLAQEESESGKVASENSTHNVGPADIQASAPEKSTRAEVADTPDTYVHAYPDDELVRNALEHRGFSGSIEHYLIAREPREQSTPESSSASIDEYLRSTEIPDD